VRGDNGLLWLGGAVLGRAPATSGFASGSTRRASPAPVGHRSQPIQFVQNPDASLTARFRSDLTAKP